LSFKNRFMPIIRSIDTNRISQEEFGRLAYEVKGHVIDIHNDFGRFFDEKIYKKELADRFYGVELEVPVTVVFGSFSKTYYLDVLVHRGGLFEFKAAELIHSRHRSQTLGYLLLFDLAHAMIFNLRPEMLGSEFVNCHQRLADLRNPALDTARFDSRIPGAAFFHDTLKAMVNDWGAGLDIGLYEEGLTHLLGGEEKVNVPVPVIGSKGHLGDQKFRMLAPDVGFKLTALAEDENNFESHARRLLEHTTLRAIHWANMRNGKITFTTLQ
jgi:GxxExxY protein